MAILTLTSADAGKTIPVSGSLDWDVYGTDAADTIEVAAGASAIVRGGAGTDVVKLLGGSADYTVKLSGSNVVFTHTSTGKTVTVPVTSAGDSVSFGNGTAVTLKSTTTTVDTTSTTTVTLGAQTLSTTDAAVTGATGTATGATTGTTAGQSFSLTTAATDGVVGTAGNDTISASTVDTMQTGDRVTDISTSDNDTLSAFVTVATAAPTLTSVESINVTAKYGTGGIDLTNSSGYTTVTVDSAIAAGSATVSNISEVATVVASTNISTLTATAKATTGTNGLVTVDAGDATSVTLTGNSGADTFAVTMKKVGTVNMNGADAGNDTYTATLVNGSNTLALSMGAGTDAATLNLAGGTLTLTGNVANETLNIASTGAANTINATATVATGASAGTITLSGGQDITLKDTSANLTGVTVTDNNTANTKVIISGTTDQNDLSKVTVDTIEIADYTTSDELKIKNGATLSFTKTGGNSGVALELGASATTDAVTLVMATDADITNGGSTTYTTKFATINVSSSAATGTISTAILGGADATINVTGSKALTLENTTTAKAVSATGLSAKLTAEANASLLSITGGTVGDAITIANVNFDAVADDTNKAVLVDAGVGDDTVTIAAITAPTDTDTTFTIDGGAGTADALVFGATADLSATAAWKAAIITGFESISTGGNTLTLTQKQLFTNGSAFTVKGGGTFNIKDDGASSKVFDISTMSLEAGVAAPAITITGHATDANTMKGASVATTFVGGSAADNITGYAGNDTVNGGAGADIINVGSGTDTLAIKAAAGAGGGDSGTFAKPATNTITTAAFDVVSGMAAGDKVQLLATAYTGAAGATAGLVANGTSVTDLTAATPVDNGLVLVRGTYASGNFVGSSSGADTLLVYDTDATLTTTSYEAIVLVGYVAASVTDIGGGTGLVTLA